MEEPDPAAIVAEELACLRCGAGGVGGREDVATGVAQLVSRWWRCRRGGGGWEGLCCRSPTRTCWRWWRWWLMRPPVACGADRRCGGAEHGPGVGGGAGIAVRGSSAARPTARLSPRTGSFMLAVAVAVAVRDVDAAGTNPPRCPLRRRCPVRPRHGLCRYRRIPGADGPELTGKVLHRGRRRF